jgi:hypothetical protein
MKLAIPPPDHALAPWNRTLIARLVKSEVFESISYLPQPKSKVDTRRKRNFCVIEVNDTPIGLDTWDTPTPSSYYLEQHEFEKSGTFGHLRLLVKIQMAKTPYWEEFRKRCPIPTTPWIMFPSSNYPLSCFEWHNSDHQYLATAFGNSRWDRKHWWAYFQSQPRIPTGRLGEQEYMQALQQSRWGLILVGKRGGGDGKNRREVEFMSCGMPLAMNYRPYYPFPFQEGEHFVYLSKPDDVHLLETLDPTPFSLASRSLWERYFTPAPMARLLVSLVEQHC